MEQEKSIIVNSEDSVSLHGEELPDPRFAVYVDEMVRVTDIPQTVL